MKKKIIHGLLALVALASTEMVASTATAVNQTFMADRGSLSNNSLISLSGRRMRKNGKDGIGAVVSAAAFYRQSYNNTKLANYFGDGTIAAASGLIDVAPVAGGATTAVTTGLLSNQIDPQALAHNAVTTEMSGKVVLNPRRIEAGAQLEWNQSLGKAIKGLWLNVAAPVVYARTEMRPTYNPNILNTAATASVGLGEGIENYFAGNNLGKTALVLGAQTLTQSALADQLITPTYNSVTQVGDVRVVLGYDFFKKKGSYRLGASLNGLIPTGNKPTGINAFEPVVGNRSFFFGAGLQGFASLWKSEDKKTAFNVRGSVNYSYGFSAAQVRTLGLTNITTGSVADAQYALVAQAGTLNMLPLANVSTLAVNVVPGSRVEAVAGLMFRYNQFAASVSYNLFYNQAEKLTLVGAFTIGNTAGYALVNGYGFTTGSTSGGIDDLGDGTALFTLPDTSTHPTVVNSGTTGATGSIVLPGEATTTTPNALDLSACTTPSQVIHKIGGDLAYRFDTSLPVRVAVGGDVDLSAGNASINSWAVWAKVGFSF